MLSANLPDPTGTSRTITLSNVALKPWTADSFGLAREYYFNEAASGGVSTRLYRRDIQNFWGNVISPATDDLLEPWGWTRRSTAKRSAIKSARPRMSARRA